MRAGECLESWVVYERPRDYPDGFIARRWEISAGSLRPTPDTCKGATLEEVRRQLPPGLVMVPAMPGDEPQIIECWV